MKECQNLCLGDYKGILKEREREREREREKQKREKERIKTQGS